MRLLAVAGATAAGLGLALSAAVPAIAAPAKSSATVSAPASVTEGDTFDVTVTLHGAVDVYGFEAVVAFDPAVAAYVDGSAVAPAGGFDSVHTGTGTVDLASTRLGTSPALSGDVAFTLRFSAVAAGSTAFSLSALSLVDAASTVTASTNDASSPAVTVEPAVVTTPTPTPTASTDPAGGTDPADGAGSTAATSADDLASTGSDVLPFALAALALLVVGAAAVLVVVRRRRTGDAR
ncbi:cohesin domain-containing protein [Leifsonia shinshuensis]|nr:cohesin domain-containing protein [Leifsonia shinshuensis]